MSQQFADDGTVTPVTILQAGPIVVTQVKNAGTDGYSAVQVGFGTRKAKNIGKAVLGHIKNLGPFQVIKEFRINEGDGEFERGQTISADIFEAGEKVDVIGTTKGSGFAGVVKRHGFAGSPASHGHKDQLRMPGSIGSQDPQHVFKGTRMGGHMGSETATTKNLEVMSVDAQNNTIAVKGAVPGARGGIVLIKTAKNA